MKAGWSTATSTVPCLAWSLSNSSLSFGSLLGSGLSNSFFRPVHGDGVVITLPDVQAQIAVDSSLVRHALRSRARLFPGLTCGISVPASTLRRDCPMGARASNQRSANASGTGDTTFSIISTGGASHTGSEGREPHCEATKTVAGIRSPALGRSRGGLTSKIHPACDGSGRPLAFVLTGGNANDCTQCTAVMDAIRVPRTGPGLDAGASLTPSRSGPTRSATGPGAAAEAGRPSAFDRSVYKRRNVVERCFNHLKQWRGIATRYDKTARSYQAAVTLASLLMWA